MNVSGLTTEERKQSEAIKTAIDTSLGIINYDVDNLYPNKIKMIAEASSTAQNCIKTYVRFLVGKGFKNKDLNKIIVNKDKKLTLLSLLRNIAYDYALFRGVTAHVNYNALGEKTSIDYVGFHTARLGKPDDKDYKNKIVVNKDWYNYLKENNKTIFSYNSNKEAILKQIESMPGETLEAKIAAYQGHIYYYSQSGGLSYPLSSIDSVATDCQTEEGLSNIMFRNVKFNFHSAGFICVKKTVEASESAKQLAEGGKINTQPKSAIDTFKTDLKGLQGDKNAGKVGVIEYEWNEEAPKFLKTEFENFDKAFTVTEETVQHKIGNIFNQPQVVRNEAVSGKLGSSSELVDGYNAYNNSTEFDRIELQEIITELMNGFIGAPAGVVYEIEPLEYQVKDNVIPTELYKDMTVDERRNLIGLEPLPLDDTSSKKMLAETLGVGGTQAMVTILTDTVLTGDQKRQLLIQLFNFTPENANLLIPIV